MSWLSWGRGDVAEPAPAAPLEGTGEMRSELRHLQSDVGEVKSSIQSVASTVEAIRMTMAGMSAQYASVDGVRQLAERVTKIERESASSSAVVRVLWLVLGLVVSVAAIVIAAYGKLWS